MSYLHADDRHKLREQLMRHEGARRDRQGLHVPYRCPAGALTIGYGHNLDADPTPGLSAISRLTEEQARELLERDIRQCEAQVVRAMPFAGQIAPARYAVLVNMCFNLGIRTLLGFRNTLGAVEDGDYLAAAGHMRRSRWARQTGNRARELARQMETGDWA
jgi:lysozyme